MDRRLFLCLPLASPAFAARAQAVADARLPPDAPDAAQRDDARFSAELLEGMARGEALAAERLSRFAGLRTLRRQVPRRGWGGMESHYTQAMAVALRWRDAGITQPQREAPFLPPQGWANGRQVLALLGAHPTRAEGGLLPYSLITNLPDGLTGFAPLGDSRRSPRSSSARSSRWRSIEAERTRRTQPGFVPASMAGHGAG